MVRDDDLQKINIKIHFAQEKQKTLVLKKQKTLVLKD